MKRTKRLMAPLALLLLSWLMPLDAFAANTTGDVNGDGEVNIADINAVIDVILGGATNPGADVNNDGEVNIADINVVIDIILGGGVPAPEDHEWVDLGLPSGTLWATCNIGATNPEDYGDHFAWGETEPKQVYDWLTYKWGYYFQGGMSKYVTDSEYGMIDYKTELELEDDAASANWGPSWCTPSIEQLSELNDECSWEWTSMNGVNGYMATGPNGNTLFLPAAGYYSEFGSNYSEGSQGDYWSRSLCANYAIKAYTLHLYGGYYGSVSMSEETREKGLSVRAVRVSPDDLHIEQQSLDLGVVPIGETCTGDLTFVNCTMNSMTLTLTADAPFSLNHEQDNASSITVVVPGNSRDTVKVMFTATTPGEFNGNVTIQNSAPDGSQRVIPIHARAITDDFPPHEYVDLGLPSGTLWATMNIGANSPEEYGDYFAWGEITPKEDYSWETYKWCDGTSSSMTKYCIDSYNGLIDHKFELEPADDAAYMNWGPSWRIPSREQLRELGQYCTWQITSINGITGHLATGPNGNTLFFPRAGMYVNGSTNYFAGQFGFYWSRTLTRFSTSACSTYSMDFTGERSQNRCNGLTVRAVRVCQ